MSVLIAQAKTVRESHNNRTYRSKLSACSNTPRGCACVGTAVRSVGVRADFF